MVRPIICINIYARIKICIKKMYVLSKGGAGGKLDTKATETDTRINFFQFLTFPGTCIIPTGTFTELCSVN